MTEPGAAGYSFLPHSGNPVVQFNYLNSEINCTYHDIHAGLGLSDSTMTVLYILYDFEGECLLGDIIRLSGASKQTVNSALRKLEGEGALTVKPFQGKRKSVRLTEQGKALVESSIVPVIQMENEIWSSWTEQEQRLYLQLTERYLTALREKSKALGKFL